MMEGDMACPTCSHTMTPLGCRVTDRTMHHCCRCGTQRLCDGEFVVPDLVRRCREFEAAAHRYETCRAAFDAWVRLGIAEAINKPENR